MKKLLGFFSIAILSSTYAHAADMQLLRSTPANGSVADAPPSAFVLEFSERVKLHDLTVKRDDEKHPKPVNNVPSAQATTFTIPAPSLTSGSYILEWRVFTQNLTAITGRVRFTVSGAQLGTTLSPTH